jgi:hypothetical protein
MPLLKRDRFKWFWKLPSTRCRRRMKAAWDDILNFKAALHDKRWAFRRFLCSLAAKQQSESGVRDEIEWLVNEYSKAMKIHNLKASPAFFEAYIIPGLEFIEDLVSSSGARLLKASWP